MGEAVIAGVVALIVAAVTSAGGFYLQRERLRQELRTQFMAEQAIVALLQHPDWKLRSFRRISRKVSGFGENELRQLLVRSGALRFESAEGTEFWGLRERNADKLHG